jgi:hypothetical protein
MKLVILVLLIAVIASLGSGLYFLSKGDQGSARVLKALKLRVALSAILLVVLISSYFLGWIAPTANL